MTYYLTLPVLEDTVSKIKRSADKAELIFDFPDQSTFTESAASRVKRLSQITERLGEPMMHGYSVLELKLMLEKYGFIIAEHLTPNKIEKRYFNNRKDNQKAFENIHFLLAKRS